MFAVFCGCRVPLTNHPDPQPGHCLPKTSADCVLRTTGHNTISLIGAVSIARSSRTWSARPETFQSTHLTGLPSPCRYQSATCSRSDVLAGRPVPSPLGAPCCPPAYYSCYIKHYHNPSKHGGSGYATLGHNCSGHRGNRRDLPTLPGAPVWRGEQLPVSPVFCPSRHPDRLWRAGPRTRTGRPDGSH